MAQGRGVRGEKRGSAERVGCWGLCASTRRFEDRAWVTSNGEGRVERREVRSEKRGGVRSGCGGGREAGCAGSAHGAGSRLKTPGWRREGGRVREAAHTQEGRGRREDGDVFSPLGRCVQFLGECVQFSRQCVHFPAECVHFWGRGSVEEGERAEGRRVRRDAEGGGRRLGPVPSAGSGKGLRETPARGPRTGWERTSTHKGRLTWRQEGTHEGAPLHGENGRGCRDDGDVSTLSGQCVQFSAGCVHF